MIVEIGSFQIRPYPNGLCWELFEYRDVRKSDGTTAKEWKSRETYPTSLDAAVRKVVELEARKGDDVCGLEEALDRLEGLTAQAVEAVRRCGKEPR